MVHIDGDFVLSLDQNDKGRFLVMACANNGVFIWQYQFDHIIPAVARYLQGIADECSCYGKDHVESAQIEDLVKIKMAR